VSVPVRVESLPRNTTADEAQLRTNPDGSVSLEAVRFEGQAFTLLFEPNGRSSADANGNTQSRTR
jgi:hypothetical protein